MDSAGHAFNSWNLAAPVTDADFDSVAAAGWDAPRQADGSLPFHGAAPDLGAFDRPRTAH
jgi:hypothetical protein